MPITIYQYGLIMNQYNSYQHLSILANSDKVITFTKITRANTKV